jgi:phosphoglycolate phosphatase
MQQQTNTAVPDLPWRSTDFDAALVDLDGTLVDTLDDFVEAVQRMLQDLQEPYCNHTAHRAELELLVGKGSENLVRRLLALIDGACGTLASASTQQRAIERYLAHYREVNGLRARVYDGAREGLEQFKALGWRLACVTNKPTAYAKDLLAKLQLDSLFSLVLGGDATERKKPDPMPLQVACSTLGVLPARALMVGDSSNDAQAARAAGCPVLLVTYGYNHGEDIYGVSADAFTTTLSTLRWKA